MTVLKILSNREVKVPFEGSKEMSSYTTVLSISMIVVSATLLLGNLVHRLSFWAMTDTAIYSKYSQVNLFFFTFNLEIVDKATWLVCLLIGFIVLLIGSIKKWHNCFSRISSSKLFLGGVLVMSMSVLIESPLNDDLVGFLWFGFGESVFLASFIAMPITYYLIQISESERDGFNWLFVAQYILFAFFLYNYLPSLLQPLWGIKDDWHSVYVINELLAPHNGQIPASNFAAQYTNLSGFVFDLMTRLSPNKGQLFIWHAASAFLTMFVLLTFYMLFVITRKMTSNAVSTVFPLTVLAFTLVTPNGVSSGQITSLLSAVPIRILPVYFVGLLLIRDFFWRRHVFLLGLVASFAAINNLDFGIPVFIATVIVMFIHPRILIYRRQNLVMFGSGVGFALLTWLVILRAYSGSFKPDYWLLFTSSFGKGFGSTPMPVVGTHVLILGLFCASIAIGSMKTKYSPDYANDVERRSAVASLFFGLIGLGAFPYFVNRSVISGQLQIFLLLAGPLLCATFSIVRIDFKMLRRPSYLMASTLVLFPQALLVGSFMQRPDGPTEWNRVLNVGSNPFSERSNIVNSAILFAETTLETDIEFGLISWGNVYLVDSQLKNVSLIDVPADAWQFGGETRRLLCSSLGQSIQAGDLIFSENFFSENGSDQLCEGYTEVLGFGNGFSIIKRV